MTQRILHIFIVLAFIACRESPTGPPENGLTQGQFVNVMIDVQLNESMRTQRGIRERNEGIDSPELYQAIFEKHGITKEEFMLSYNYFKEHPGEMELVYEAVLDSLSRLEAEIKQAYTASQNAKRDSIETAKRKNFEKMRGLDSQE